MAATRNRAKVEESGIHEEIGGSSQGKIPVGVKSERRRLLICQNARSEREPGVAIAMPRVRRGANYKFGEPSAWEIRCNVRSYGECNYP